MTFKFTLPQRCCSPLFLVALLIALLSVQSASAVHALAHELAGNSPYHSQPSSLHGEVCDVHLHGDSHTAIELSATLLAGFDDTELSFTSLAQHTSQATLFFYSSRAPPSLHTSVLL